MWSPKPVHPIAKHKRCACACAILCGISRSFGPQTALFLNSSIVLSKSEWSTPVFERSNYLMHTGAATGNIRRIGRGRRRGFHGPRHYSSGIQRGRARALATCLPGGHRCTLPTLTCGGQHSSIRQWSKIWGEPRSNKGDDLGGGATRCTNSRTQSW